MRTDHEIQRTALRVIEGLVLDGKLSPLGTLQVARGKVIAAGDDDKSRVHRVWVALVTPLPLPGDEWKRS